MKRVIFALFAVTAIAPAAFGASYELRRITVAADGTADRYVIRCHLSPDAVYQSSELAGVLTERTFPVKTNADTVQAWVNAAKGVSRPTFTNASNYTNWWVRGDAYSEFKLVRSNVQYHDGNSRIYQDESEAGQRLATFMGINCLRVFGQ